MLGVLPDSRRGLAGLRSGATRAGLAPWHRSHRVDVRSAAGQNAPEFGARGLHRQQTIATYCESALTAMLSAGDRRGQPRKSSLCGIGRKDVMRRCRWLPSERPDVATRQYVIGSHARRTGKTPCLVRADSSCSPPRRDRAGKHVAFRGDAASTDCAACRQCRGLISTLTVGAATLLAHASRSGVRPSRSLTAHPGGQLSFRPPSTCRWM